MVLVHLHAIWNNRTCVRSIMIVAVFILVLWSKSIECQGDEKSHFEPFIVNGNFGVIKDFSFTIFLHIKRCTKVDYACGSSILNQWIMLSAAHCVYGCGQGIIKAHYGNANRHLANFYIIQSYLTHPNFKVTGVKNDIAVLRTRKPFSFASNIGRVAIFNKKFIPYTGNGTVAGWGYTNEVEEILSPELRFTWQKIRTRIQCEKKFGLHLPLGIICGGRKGAKQFTSAGDSGSALVILGYIQVGIVSYKEPSFDAAVAMYTDVSYFYDWIRVGAFRLYCLGKS